MVRFSKFFQLYISKLNFSSFKENNHDGRTAFLAGFRLFFFIFNIFLHIFSVYSPVFKKFSVIDIKIKFPVVLRKQSWRSDCLLAGFCYFYICYFAYFQSTYLWCFGQILKFFGISVSK